MFSTPILFLVFNRPDTTQKVFQAIKSVQPPKLYIAADGPRMNKEGEVELCKEVKDLIENEIDWDCDVYTLFRSENLGCGKAIQGALDWFFNFENEGIILEDDTLPSPFFFTYCSTLLDRYRKDETIFSINGCSLGYSNNNYDYGVTNYFNMWGWATWKRSNEKVKKHWYKFIQNPNILNDKRVLKQLNIPSIWGMQPWYNNWQKIFYLTAKHKMDTWDYQWLYTTLKTQSSCIRPNQNYIINLGFGENATHTVHKNDPLGKLSHDEKKVNIILKGLLVNDSIYEKEYVAKRWVRFDFFANNPYIFFMCKIKNKIGRLLYLRRNPRVF